MCGIGLIISGLELLPCLHQISKHTISRSTDGVEDDEVDAEPAAIADDDNADMAHQVRETSP